MTVVDTLLKSKKLNSRIGIFEDRELLFTAHAGYKDLSFKTRITGVEHMPSESAGDEDSAILWIAADRDPEDRLRYIQLVERTKNSNDREEFEVVLKFVRRSGRDSVSFGTIGGTIKLLGSEKK